MANLVTYAKQKWEDAKTAITAARLNNMEQGINDCATQINALGDSVSQNCANRVWTKWTASVTFTLTDGSFGLLIACKERNDEPSVYVIRGIQSGDTISYVMSCISKGSNEITLANDGYNVTLSFVDGGNGSMKLFI